MTGKKSRAAQVITAVQGKGGAGKTTLLSLLAVEMAAAGARVVLLDCDSQGSAARLFEQDTGDGVDVAAVERDEDLDGTVEALRDTYDVIFIDTPGYKATVSIYAVQLADLVLVPVGKSLSDITEALLVWRSAEASLKRAGRTAAVRMVLNHAKSAGEVLSAVRDTLAEAEAPVLSADLREIDEISRMMLFRQIPKGRGRQAFRAVLGALQQEGLLDFYAAGGPSGDGGRTAGETGRAV